MQCDMINLEDLAKVAPQANIIINCNEVIANYGSGCQNIHINKESSFESSLDELQETLKMRARCED